jgi:hypothetical protein
MANVNGSSATLTNVAFKSNLCTYNIPSPVCYGGGMITQGSNPTLTNVLFSGNLGDWGAGLANLGGNPLLTNITASGNHATAQGGGLFNLSNTPQIRNSVFWNNRDVTGTGTWSASIFSSGLQYPTISYSLVQGSGGSGDDWVPTVGTDGGHNIDADPRFKASVNPADAPTVSGDLRFPHFSPAIDAGYNDFNDTAKDFWGLARKVDGNDDGTVVIDMGAYEGPEVTLRYIFLPLINR